LTTIPTLDTYNIEKAHKCVKETMNLTTIMQPKYWG